MGEREDWVKSTAKKYAKGRFTASQTGATQFAKKRKDAAELKATLQSVGNMEDFEKNIQGGSRPPRPSRSKR